jgi:F0F1-type ATP synthase beta subunit
MEKNDIAHYDELTPRVESVRGRALTVFVGDARCDRGDLVTIPGQPPVYARVFSHVGGRRVLAMLLAANESLQEGRPITLSGERAAVAYPTAGVNQSSDLSFVTAHDDASYDWEITPLAFQELGSEQRPLKSGIDALDTICPLVHGGVNLILDTGADDAPWNMLLRCVFRHTPPTVWVGRSTETFGAQHVLIPRGDAEDSIWCLRTGLSWLQGLRKGAEELTLVGELPTADFGGEPTLAGPGETVSLSEVVNLIGSALVSSRRTSITTLLRAKVPADGGVSELIDSLPLGDVDAQILITPEATVDPRRSTSKAEFDVTGRQRQTDALQLLARADAIGDRIQLWGIDELDEEELMVLEAVKGLAIELSE